MNKKLSNKCKKRSLNLASYHESVSSNFTPLYTRNKMESNRFDNILRATKNARKKRARRTATRAYLYDCPCEYSPVVKTEKTREVKADIRFPHPTNISAIEREEKYTFRYSSEGKEFTRDVAMATVRKKFLRWCNARGFTTGDKMTLNTVDGAWYLVVEKCPDMRIIPTKSVSSCI